MRDLIPKKTRKKRRPTIKELPHLPVADEVHIEDPPTPEKAETE